MFEREDTEWLVIMYTNLTLLENFMEISERTNKQNLKEELIQNLGTHWCRGYKWNDYQTVIIILNKLYIICDFT